MNIKWVCVLNCLWWCVAFGESERGRCQFYLDDLDHSQRDFVSCMTLNTLNSSKFCLVCGPAYRIAEQAYDTYKNNTKHCWAVHAFFKQRIETLDRFSYILAALWERSNCDECLKFWEQYGEKIAKYDECTGSSMYSVCWACAAQYDDLMQFYGKMLLEDPQNFCFEWSANMNSTREEWNLLYNCGRNGFLVLMMFLLLMRVVIRIVSMVWRRLGL